MPRPANLLELSLLVACLATGCDDTSLPSTDFVDMGAPQASIHLGGDPNALRCHDGMLDGQETDVDCGGPCWPCTDRRHCRTYMDCFSKRCSSSECVDAFEWAPTTIPTEGAGIAQLVTGDFDGDGHLDIGAAIPPLPDKAETSPGKVAVLWGRGDATFVVEYADGGPNICSLSTGDFNRDGIADLVSQSFDPTKKGSNPADGVRVLSSGRDRRFVSAFSPFLVGDVVATADVDGDGQQDLVALGYGALVLLGRGDGTFHRGPTALPSAWQDAECFGVLDLNGDQMPDILCASPPVVGESWRLQVLLNLGHQQFTEAPTITVPGRSSPPFIVGAFDDTGAASVFVLAPGGSIRTASYPLRLPGPENPTPLQRSIGFGLAADHDQKVILADFDGNGFLDAFSDSPWGFSGNAYFAKGDGTFELGDLTGHNGIRGLPIVAGDFDENGLPDLAVAFPDGSVGILLNHRGASGS